MKTSRYLAAMLRSEFYGLNGFSEDILCSGLEQLGPWKLHGSSKNAFYDAGEIYFELLYQRGRALHGFRIVVGPEARKIARRSVDGKPMRHPPKLVLLLLEALDAEVEFKDEFMQANSRLMHEIYLRIKQAGTAYRQMYTHELNELREKCGYIEPCLFEKQKRQPEKRSIEQ